MENSFSVVPDGTVSVYREGCYTVLRYTGSIQDKVCRLWLLPEDRTWVSIGIPAPKNGQLELQRKYTRTELLKTAPDLSGKWLLLPAGEVPQQEEPEKNPLPKAEPAPAEDPALYSAGANLTSSSAGYEDGWRECSDPQALFSDLELQECFSEISGALRRDNAETVELAVPFTPGGTFPALPIFCFGECSTVHGKSCVIFTVENGQPIF